jgi:HSP20 family protein
MAFTDLIPWSRARSATTPFSEDRDPFLALHRDMTRLLDEFTRGFGLPNRGGWSSGWPSVEVGETDREFKVVAELPGLEEKDVELSFTDGVLTIKGEKSRQNDAAFYSERWHGQFQRAFQIGPNVDPDKVGATFKNGVLTVTLPKRAEAKPQSKRIPIAAN